MRVGAVWLVLAPNLQCSEGLTERMSCGGDDAINRQTTATWEITLSTRSEKEENKPNPRARIRDAIQRRRAIWWKRDPGACTVDGRPRRHIGLPDVHSINLPALGAPVGKLRWSASHCPTDNPHVTHGALLRPPVRGNNHRHVGGKPASKAKKSLSSLDLLVPILSTSMPLAQSTCSEVLRKRSIFAYHH